MTPLLDAVKLYAARGTLRMHMPGHKGGALPFDLSPSLDVTELPGTVAPIRDAERLLANFYGARDAVFLTCGSSQGVFAMLYAVCERHSTILVDRMCHRSVAHAAELLELNIVFIHRLARVSDSVALPVSPSDLDDVLTKEYSAVVITSPSYHGVLCDLPALHNVCKARGVPLLIDGAHGAHLKPPPDFELMTLSAHKTLPAIGQSAFLLVNDERLTGRLRHGAELAGTSSPSYLIMCNLDAARDYMEHTDFTPLYEAVDTLDVDCLLRSREFQIDPLRLTLRVKNGEKAAEFLRSQGVEPEWNDEHTVILILSLADTPETVAKISNIIRELDALFPDNGELTIQKTYPLGTMKGDEFYEAGYGNPQLGRRARGDFAPHEVRF
ncbi:hypothetical protein FACS189425_10050 [Clostridia bacterium]|nr:hypothetical protein FACS189425_10050 [Clostridia bacterium]